MDRYVRRLTYALAERGYARDLLIMNGNGGTVAANLVSREAAKTVMSGPASGVMAAAATLQASGLANAITYDMGGTSTDVALIAGGIPEVSAELAIDYGLPIHVPMVDVRTVGAGGGSIATLNAAGLLKIGPESAGAAPGPIAFGRGGSRVTITDANVLLGRLPQQGLTAITGATDLAAIRSAVDRDIDGPLGLSTEAAADAIIRLANVHMAGAIRMVSLSRGYDPRDFVLFAFGGAGPLHASLLAREIGVPAVLVPARPDMTNALRRLDADLRQDFVQTLNAPLETVAMAHVAETLNEHARRGTSINAGYGDIEESIITYSADMQFRGQTHLIRVGISGPTITRDELQQAFEHAYFSRFQVNLPEIRAQLVNLNTSVVGKRQTIPLTALLDPARRAAAAAEAKTGTRKLFANGRWLEAAVFSREVFPIEAVIYGLSIIEQIDATTVIEPGARARVDGIGNLRIAVRT